VDSGRNVVSRLIWLVLVLGGIALAVYQIQDRILYYASNPTSTNVVLVDSAQLTFPQVTICNENRVMKSTADLYGTVYDPHATATSLYLYYDLTFWPTMYINRRPTIQCTVILAEFTDRLRSCYKFTKSSQRGHCRETADCETGSRIYDKIRKLEL